MFVDGPNPTKVQGLPANKRFNKPAPLVLIHDGGGTTFSYFIVGNLHREVWAIHNPKYWTSDQWDGGMEEMAKHYISLMVDAGISGPIILGGWSLGGYLSLTIARALADDISSKISIAGMLIIDSPYHIARSQLEEPTSRPALEGIPDLVKKSFDNCDVMLEHWGLPSWRGPANGGNTVDVSVAGRRFTLKHGQIIFKSLKGSLKSYESTPQEENNQPGLNIGPPPAVLLKCINSTKSSIEGAAPCLVDLHRNKTMLGWEGDYPDFIKGVFEVDGDHYNMFDKYDQPKINEALEILDSMTVPMKSRPVMDFF